MWMPVRSAEAELMDRLDSDSTRLERTLRQLQWINRLLFATRRLAGRTILADLRRLTGSAGTGAQKTYTLVDIGAGGCDLACWLTRREPRLRVTCLDHDPRVVAYARRRCARCPGVEVRHGTAADIAGMEPFDYMFAGLLLHHLPDGQIVPLLDAMLRRTRRLFVISDLLRSPLPYLGYALFSAVFLHRSFARFDGLLSIRKGFRLQELKRLLTATSQPERLQLRRQFPGRLCVIGRPTAPAPADPAV